MQVCKDVDKYDIKERYVRKILPDEYKNANKVRDPICGPRAANVTVEQKKPLLVTNNGETTDQNAENTLDEIYGGKSFSQMKKEADIEVADDKEETLENPANGLQHHRQPTTPTTAFLSDKSPEFRAMEARMDEMTQTMNQLVEDRDTARQQTESWSKKFNQVKGGLMAEEDRRLNVENSNYRVLLQDVDRESLAKEGYKKVEVFKLQQDTIRMLKEVSSKSERTFFLLVHTKTMQIKAAKTDKEMHQIQAKRAAGVL
ncbi:hypothetical protein [Candidatus Nitrosocosmicus sp. SS]|uniref:hypothetical protein n=1 Tax=Candidatus Nitrosocosmicus agrestis TaxID=2563600 RepID=UPI00122E7E04|nr:hypothetical protein [Candidatus Nitrosocosmicus sp. SS]KAA2281222.1 hypothetical protein F1Z66_08875 [Candidatus Nitrosocosmicus sp. SS]KAF0868363.1 hypothetical protein E5N71_10430 [Candidatus Nitrosocosmicus sp. SS]